MEMNRLWICLLALLVLAGCGGNPTDVGVTLVVPQSAGSYSLNMETEWMEYDPSVDSIWCILSYEMCIRDRARVDSVNAVAPPSRAMSHIQNTAP